MIATRVPGKILNDNGTNFSGANNLLQKIFVLLIGSSLENEIKRMSQGDKMKWNFSTSNSPHFGGLHETVVKLSEHHLKKMTTNAKITIYRILHFEKS